MMEPRRLAAIRERWGLTQAEFARLFAVSSPLIISQWENGYRNPSGIVKKLYRLLDELPEHQAKKLLDWLRSVKLQEKDRRKLSSKRGRKK